MLDGNISPILEKHAPLYSCIVLINQNEPWYYAIKSGINAAENISIGQKDSTKKYPIILNRQKFCKKFYGKYNA